jgi:flagellar biosynthesis protein FlhG
MPDQADMLRKLVRSAAVADDAPAGAARLLLVASAKGGVGTTTVAVQLAAALTELGRGSVLVDADLGRAHATSHLGVAPREGLDDLLEERCTIESLMMTVADGVRLLPAAWAPSHPCQPTLAAGRRLLAELQRLPVENGWMVVDGGSNRSPLCDHLWQHATRVLLVTTCEDLAVMDTYARIKSLSATGFAAPLSIVVNRAGTSAPAMDVQGRLEQSCRRFLGLTIDAAGQIPHLEALTPTGGCPVPLPARDPSVKREFAQLARRLTEAAQTTPLARIASMAGAAA